MYKGLLVVFSLFLAYESRNVKAFYLNDSKHVIIALLATVLLVGSGAPVSLVLALFFIPNGAYVVAVVPIILSCVCSAGILFVPKVKYFLASVWNTRYTPSLSDGVAVQREGFICAGCI